MVFYLCSQAPIKGRGAEKNIFHHRGVVGGGGGGRKSI